MGIECMYSEISNENVVRKENVISSVFRLFIDFSFIIHSENIEK
jgi:hypothetical protein